MTPLLFLDTETTGLDQDDEVWEIAAVLRQLDGPEEELHLFIEHDSDRCARLPLEFRNDHDRRFPKTCGGYEANVASRAFAVGRLSNFVPKGAHVVGALPSFDTQRLERMARSYGRIIPWHHHLLDVENIVAGFLAANGQLPPLPWKSDDLSRAIGVDPEKFDRHTAMGDVRWVMAQWDAVFGSAA